MEAKKRRHNQTRLVGTLDGKTLHFNYDLQVWIKDGLIQGCEHPNCLDTTKDQECNAHKYQGKSLKEI